MCWAVLLGGSPGIPPSEQDRGLDQGKGNQHPSHGLSECPGGEYRKVICKQQNVAGPSWGAAAYPDELRKRRPPPHQKHTPRVAARIETR